MHRYSKKFQLLPFGFDIPTINLIVFITRWLGGYKEKGRPPLQFVRISSLGNIASGKVKKERVQLVAGMQLFMKHVERVDFFFHLNQSMMKESGL